MSCNSVFSLPHINQYPYITQFHALLKNTQVTCLWRILDIEINIHRNTMFIQMFICITIACCYKILAEVMNDNLNMPAIFSLHNLFMLLHAWPESSSCQAKSSEKPRGMNRPLRNIWANSKNFLRIINLLFCSVKKK